MTGKVTLVVTSQGGFPTLRAFHTTVKQATVLPPPPSAALAQLHSLTAPLTATPQLHPTELCTGYTDAASTSVLSLPDAASLVLC